MLGEMKTELMSRRLRQFKYEFRGLKKVTTNEWTLGVLPEIRKRTLEGKDSDVYLYGQKLCPKRIRREHDRFSASLGQDLAAVDTSKGCVVLKAVPRAVTNTDLVPVIGSNIEDRLCVRTPPPNPLLPSTAPEDLAQDNATGDLLWEGTLAVSSRTPRLASSPLSPYLETGLSVEEGQLSYALGYGPG